MLTVTEYKILFKLISERSIITRAALLDALRDVDSRFVDDNTLSVHISRCRCPGESKHTAVFELDFRNFSFDFSDQYTIFQCLGDLSGTT